MYGKFFWEIATVPPGVGVDTEEAWTKFPELARRFYARPILAIVDVTPAHADKTTLFEAAAAGRDDSQPCPRPPGRTVAISQKKLAVHQIAVRRVDQLLHPERCRAAERRCATRGRRRRVQREHRVRVAGRAYRRHPAHRGHILRQVGQVECLDQYLFPARRADHLVRLEQEVRQVLAPYHLARTPTPTLMMPS